MRATAFGKAKVIEVSENCGSFELSSATPCFAVESAIIEKFPHCSCQNGAVAVAVELAVQIGQGQGAGIRSRV